MLIRERAQFQLQMSLVAASAGADGTDLAELVDVDRLVEKFLHAEAAVPRGDLAVLQALRIA